MDENLLKQQIQKLIDKYKLVLQSGKINKYTEEETKKDFILPLFEVLGWNVTDKNEVSAEETQSGGRVDYGFYLNDRIKFYIEAKKLSSDLHNEEYAKQAIRYSWNKGVNWAILTDFESIKVFYTQDPNQSLFSKLLFEIKVDEYLERLDQLRLLSKEAFQTDEIDAYAEKIGKKMQKISVGDQLYKHLNECRKLLIEKLGAWNEIKDQDLLDEGVQKLLDRLIFIRVAEDRGIEQPTLIPLIREWEANKSKTGIQIYESMIDKFRELDEIYNSNLFSPHPFENWKEHSGITEKVVEILQGKPGYYEYDFKVMPADVLGAVYENYLGHRLAESQKGIVLDKNAKKRKEQGIYYTPEFIVDYIVRNALKPVLDKCKSVNDLQKIKVLDPACGSGSFLIKALQVINEKYKEFNYPGDENTKILILLQNIYGVDLDEQAVEITRLNLLLSALETRMQLPKLDKNIKNGNSLISGTDEELKKYFGENYRDKKPFNWEEEFPEVFKQGGFDVVVGNPPYIGFHGFKEEKNYLTDKYKSAVGKFDIYIPFIEKGLDLLRAEGFLSYICPTNFYKRDHGVELRKILTRDYTIKEITDFKDTQIFSGALNYTGIVTIQNNKPSSDSTIIYKSPSLKASRNSILQSTLSDAIWVFRANNSSAIEKIEKWGMPLGNIAAAISEGIVTGSNDVFLVTKKDINKFQFEEYILRPCLRGRDIQRYYYMQPKEYVIFPYEHRDGRTGVIEENRLPKNVHSYLLGKKKDLSGRGYFEKSNKQWYELWNQRDLNIMETTKIVVPEVAQSNRFALADKDIFYGDTVCAVTLKESRLGDYLYILGILNSKLIEYYYRETTVPKANKYFIYKTMYLKKIPIFVPKKSPDMQLKASISRLCKEILELYDKLSQQPENSNRWNELKSEIEETDKKIDEEVYKLYGLTPEEIAIVEGKNENN